MTGTHPRLTALMLTWAALASACTNATDGETTTTQPAADCPDLSGVWTFRMHCTSSYVGAQVSIEQKACSLVAHGALEGLRGAVTKDGAFMLRGSGRMCGGVGNAKMITATCDTSCVVTLGR